MRNTPFWWILIGFMLLLDLYFFQALKTVSHAAATRTRLIIYTSYWAVSLGAIVCLIILPYLQFGHQARLFKSTLFAIIAGLFFAKLIAAVFFFIDDIRRGVQWIAEKFPSRNKEADAQLSNDRISRSAFLSWAGIIAGGGLFGSLVWGFSNKYRYQVRRVRLSYANLPNAFKGLRIVQISDIHCGSFNNKKAVMKGVQKIMNEKPDLVLFTGDLVNNVADEMQEYLDVFEKIKAPLGVFSILGNHDYGDYVRWSTPAEKKNNLDNLKEVYRALGWRLMMNENIILEKGDDKIALIGVENWSALKRFPKYGDLSKAYAGADAAPFRILMSHDPSHWKAEVCPQFPGIDLMLAGHTHGLQFGVEVPGFRWSPVQYVYKQWAGLYENGAQKLYVNRGFGFLGYPGRVGILPEITVLDLV